MTPEERQINLQAETLYKNALIQYFKDGLDLRKYPYLASDMRILCRLLAVMSVKQAGMMVNSLEQVFEELKKLKESTAPADNSKLDRLAIEVKTLTQVIGRKSSQIHQAKQTWWRYITSPPGIMGGLIAVLMLLNLVI